MPGEGLEPSRGKPSQDFKSCAFFVGRARIEMTGPTCVWSVGESTFAANQNTPFQFRAQFRAQLADFRLFRATSYLGNMLIYKELLGCGGGI